MWCWRVALVESNRKSLSLLEKPVCAHWRPNLSRRDGMCPTLNTSTAAGSSLHVVKRHGASSAWAAIPSSGRKMSVMCTYARQSLLSYFVPSALQSQQKLCRLALMRFSDVLGFKEERDDLAGRCPLFLPRYLDNGAL